MFGLTGRPAQGFLGRAVMRGVIRRSRPWQAVLVVTLLSRLIRLAGRQRPVVLRERLSPGEALEVRHLASPAQGDGGPATEHP
jgi:hypothetical protein